MPGPVVGMFFYLYLIRCLAVVCLQTTRGWISVAGRSWAGEVHERESADLAAVVIRQAVLAEGCIARPLVLHADPNIPTGAAQ